MALYLVSYDLTRPEPHYPELAACLTRLGATRVLYSEWLVRSMMGVGELRDRVVREGGLGEGDGILVVELRRSAAWERLLIADATAQQFFRSAEE